MICVSTRGQSPSVPFRQAVAAGLAPDGGLYVPATLPAQPGEWWQALRGASFGEVSRAMAAVLVGAEFDAAELDTLLTDALDFPIPIVRLDDRLSVVELFHGPTFAFKDIGARVLARFLSRVNDDDGRPLTILVATSGDTGSAVAHAFLGVPGTRVVVLYPRGQVSDVQEAQFTTLGGNVTAVSVAGTFDDCQRLAKEAFADEALRARVRLTSANSISLGRLVPQMFYYAHAALDAPAGSPVVISVPSGNFGNLVAGVMAWKMGAPIAGFAAATTINDAVPRYMASGRFEPMPSVTTLANAMDVGNPSNFERLLWTFGGSRAAMRAMIATSVHTDDDVRHALRDLQVRYNYVADPHTAIAYLGARQASASHFLATAHPAKFAEVVEPAIGQAVPLPAPLAEAMARPRHSEPIPATLAELVKLL
jgi:threonine synthase